MDKHYFWSLDQSKYNANKLAEIFEEAYANDFVDNYDFWKKQITELNNDIYNTLILNHQYDSKRWQEITFDWFCQQIINTFKDSIIKNGQITRIDAVELTLQVCKKWGQLMLDKAEEDMQKESLVSLLVDGVKTFVAK